MPSLVSRNDRPNLVAAFYGVDGRRKQVSTGTSNRDEALQILAGWTKAANLARNHALTPDKAREIIARTVADCFEASTGEPLTTMTTRRWVGTWLSEKRATTGERTIEKFERVEKLLLEHLGSRADRDLSLVTAEEIAKLRDRISKDVTPSTANNLLKCLHACFGLAFRRGLIARNPVSSVEKLSAPSEFERKALERGQIDEILTQAAGSEWEGMILVGLYTGQRLGDVARIKQGQADLLAKTFRWWPTKTKRSGGKPIVIRMPKPLFRYFEGAKSSDDPEAFVFPRAAVKAGTNLSQDFRNLLADAGLAERLSKDSKGIGRDKRRTLSALSFHSLRHSTRTFLSAAGVNDSTIDAIMGHSTTRMRKTYTHLSPQTLGSALDKLPDVKSRSSRQLNLALPNC